MSCPPTPTSLHPRELGFKRMAMVRWYSPRELIRTGVKILLSSLFGSYADKREVLALQEISEHDYSAESELWIDYIADVGDGFNSTYTMASLLALEELRPAGSSKPLARGRLLIFGGDQVYPTATRDLYQDRLIGPYRAALPWVDVERDEDAPHLFAIPGNHDWYDGLTSFNRLFTQRRWLGGRLTRQTRSYFALALPHGWWLWGVDVQLESDIDQPQLDYFRTIAKTKMQPGSKVILCTAEPSWVYARQEQDVFGNLAYLERIVIKRGGTVVLSLAGDLHHYARYAADDGSCQKITAGGGGAFYHETHNLPRSFSLTTRQNGAYKKTSYSQAGRTFPSAGESRRLIFRNLLFPFKNWYFSLFLGSFYLLFAWIIESASIKERWDQWQVAPRLGSDGAVSFLERIWNHAPSLEAFPEVFRIFSTIALHSPSSFILLLVLVFGLIAYLEPNKNHPPWLRQVIRWSLGGLHGAAHVVALICVTWTVGYVNHTVLGFEKVKYFWHAAHFVPFVALLGGLVGGTIWGVYLLVANLLFGCHSNAGSSAVKVQDFKSFLRLHLTAEKLEIHAIGVREVNRRWKLNRTAMDGDPWLVPKKGKVLDLAEVLEVVSIEGRRPSNG